MKTTPRTISGISWFAIAVAVTAFTLTPMVVLARPPVISGPDANGFRWATIDRPGNAPYTGPAPYGFTMNLGRGRVDYNFRIAQSEISSAQWVEFVNTFSTRADFPTQLFGYRAFTQVPLQSFGVWEDPSYTGPGTRYITTNPNGQDVSTLPVFGIGWRDAAMYCNWLHNGKSSDPSSLFGGAYDTSTWGQQPRPAPLPGFYFTDKITHEVGAKYWIPTLDEWMKAAFYDPDKNGPGQGGWWTHLNASDSPPIPGLPGTPGATTSGGVADYYTAWTIPLGAYPNALSPWGLLDTASGGNEWVQEPIFNDDLPGGPPPIELIARGLSGVFAGDTNFLIDSHASVTLGGGYPRGDFSTLRIASVPTPSACLGLVVMMACHAAQRRQRR